MNMKGWKPQSLLKRVKFQIKKSVDKNKIKIALLGLGRIGQMHAKNLIENRI